MKAEHEERRDGAEYGRKKPNAEGVIAPDSSARSLDDRDQRRLAVIGKRGVFRPNPLISFILREGDAAAGDVGQVHDKLDEDQGVTQPQPLLVEQDWIGLFPAARCE